MIEKLTEEDARSVLDACLVGRLGCVYEDGPYVVPINYAIEGEHIYIHALPGRKIEALRKNPRACIQVDEIIDELHWRSAIAFGTYEEITDQSERERAVRALHARFPGLTPVESVPVHDGQSSVIVFRIRVTETTGVCER